MYLVDIIIFPFHILMIFDFIIYILYIGNFRCSIHNFHFQSLALEAPYQGTPGIAQCPPENTDPWATVFEAQMAGNSHPFFMKITIRSYQIISNHICHICHISHIKSMEKNGSFKCQTMSKTSTFQGHSAGFLGGCFVDVGIWHSRCETRAWGAELPNCSLPSCPDPVSVPRRVNSIVDVRHLQMILPEKL